MRLSGIPAFLLLALVACGPATSTTAPAFDYAALLRYDLAAIQNAERELQAQPGDVQAREGLALAWLQKAQLSGDFLDYAAADRALDQAFAVSDELHAPLTSRLRLDLILHRLPRAVDDLARLDRRYFVRQTAGYAGERAELAFQQGRYAEALDSFRRSLDIQEGVLNLARLALWYSKTGHYSEAAALLDRAAKLEHSDTPYLHAWLELQQGLLLLDRGRWEQADEFFLHAESLLPGWWLARSRHAQVLALSGQREQAQALYEAVAGETHDPEFMDAVARLRREGPQPASARAWVERAAAAHRQRLELLPEAALGHALEHELWFGQPDQALALARRNAALRPNGESRILLAEALFRAGHASEAGQEIQAVQASAWDTAELHAIAAQIAAGLGRRDDADAQRVLALARNPRAFRMYPLPQPAQPEAVP